MRFTLLLLLAVAVMRGESTSARLAKENLDLTHQVAVLKAENQALRFKLDATTVQLSHTSIAGATSKAEAASSKRENTTLKKNAEVALVNNQQVQEAKSALDATKTGVDATKAQVDASAVITEGLKHTVDRLERTSHLQTFIIIVFMSGLYTFQIIAAMVKAKFKNRRSQKELE